MFAIVSLTAPCLLKRFARFLLPAVLLFLLAGCDGAKKQPRFRIGFSQCTGGDDWRRTMLSEMQRELSFHSEIDFIYKDAEASSEKQVAQIRTLADEGIDLLIVTPNEVTPLTPVIEEVYAKGIPVVLVDRRIDSRKYTAFIGASNFEVGQAAGQYAASLLKGKGRVLEIAGLPAGASPPIDRHRGFMDVIDRYPGMELVNLFYDAREEEAALAKIPDIDLVYAQNDFMAKEASGILRKLGLQDRVKVIGIDGLAIRGGGLEMVENGTIAATMLYPTGGQEAILTSVNILNRKPFEAEQQLSTTVIDSTNIRITLLQNQKVLAQQEDIDRRQQRIEEQELIRRNQDRIIVIVSVTLGLSLVLGLVLFFSLKANRRISRRLGVKNAEIELQRNQLIELGRKAEEANEARVNFFTNVSHELRTPLTLIIGPADEILAHPRLPVVIRSQMELMKKNALRLLRLVNELMDFRKIEHSKMKIRVTENDITEFVTDITDAFASVLAKKRISFKVISHVPGMKAWFDLNMVDKILFNLLSNAVKYTNEFGFIHVTVTSDDVTGSVLVRVEDSGVGMERETMEHAFDLFYQGEDGRQKGTGLGLALSKELITLHHGSITIQSEKGRGATFEVRLPGGRDHFSESDIAKDPVDYEPSYEDARIFLEHQTLPAGRAAEDPQPMPGKTVLLIEDNAELRGFTRNLLAGEYEVIEAGDGDEGLQLAFERIPDIVVCDVLLPGRQGTEITAILKSDSRTAHIPVIILTAQGSVEKQIDGLKTNADSYIVKPFNGRHLVQVIRGLLVNREKLQGHYSSELPVKPGQLPVDKKIERKFTSQFTSIVEDNISNESFSVNDICTSMGISRVLLYRKVKTLLGCNVNEYIMNVRLQKSQHLLLHEDLSISEISLSVGFSSPTYFATVFKTRFGVTPKAYRQKARGG